MDQKTSAHRHDALAQDLGQVREQQAAAAQVVADFNARVEQAAAGKSGAQAAVAGAQQGLADLTKEFREAQRRLQDIDRQLAQRGARLKLLQQLQERWEGFGEGAKAVLQGRLDEALAGAPAVPVARGLEIKPEFGAAIEALLGSAAEAIGVSDVATAQRILAQLERDQIGSAILRIEEFSRKAGRGANPARRPPAGDGGPARSRGLPSRGGAPRGLLPGRRPQCLPGISGGPIPASSSSRSPRAVARSWTGAGSSPAAIGRASRPRASSSARSTCARPRRALADEQKLHDEQKALIDGLSARLTAAEQALEQHRGELLAATQTVAAAQAEQRNAQRAHEEAAGRLARMEKELAACAAARNEAQARWQKAQAGLADAEAATGAHRERISQLDAQLAQVRAEREAKRESLAQARLELAERRQKVEVLDRGLGEMAKRRGQLDDLLVQRQQEIEAWTEQTAALEREAADQRARAVQMEATFGVARDQVEKIRGELVGIEREIGALEGGAERPAGRGGRGPWAIERA